MKSPKHITTNAIRHALLITGFLLLFCTNTNGQFQQLERNINREINNAVRMRNYWRNAPAKKTPANNRYSNNSYQFGSSQYDNQPGVDPYKDDEYLFINKGQKGVYVDNRSQKFYKATQRNILNKDENEEEYLKELIYFSANNKLGNKSMHRCRYKTLKYTVTQRDNSGMPSVVDATYEYKEAPEVFYQMTIFLSSGLPYRIHYGNESLWARRIDEEGVIGSLYFAPEEATKILQLESELVDKLSTYAKANVYPRINDSLTKLVKTKYPGLDCSKCLVRTVKPRTQGYQIETTDAFGHKTYDYTSATDYHISIKNKCDKPIKVIGVWQSIHYPGAREYKIVFKHYKPHQELFWDIDYSPTLFDHHEVDNDDIDLQQINKSFNYKGGEYQWLRIIQDK